MSSYRYSHGTPRLSETGDGRFYSITCACGWTRRLCTGGTGYTAALRLQRSHADSHLVPDPFDPYTMAN